MRAHGLPGPLVEESQTVFYTSGNISVPRHSLKTASGTSRRLAHSTTSASFETPRGLGAFPDGRQRTIVASSASVKRGVSPRGAASGQASQSTGGDEENSSAASSGSLQRVAVPGLALPRPFATILYGRSQGSLSTCSHRRD